MITYLWFKVLSVASHYFFPSFRQLSETISKKRCVFWGDPRIEPFFDFFIRAEMLMSQAMCHRSKQMVVGWSNVWRVWRVPSIGFHRFYNIGPTVDMLQNRRLSASTRTEPNFLASESFPWLWGVSKWLVESLPIILTILLAFGKSLQQIMPPIWNLRKFSPFHRHSGPRHHNHRQGCAVTRHSRFFT